MDWNDLKDYIGVDNDEESGVITDCWDSAVELIDLAVDTAWRPIPESILNRLYLEVGNALYDRRNAPSGQSQFATFEGGALPVRGPRDPLAQVRPILALYVAPF